ICCTRRQVCTNTLAIGPGPCVVPIPEGHLSPKTSPNSGASSSLASIALYCIVPYCKCLSGYGLYSARMSYRIDADTDRGEGAHNEDVLTSLASFELTH